MPKPPLRKVVPKPPLKKVVPKPPLKRLCQINFSKKLTKIKTKISLKNYNVLSIIIFFTQKVVGFGSTFRKGRFLKVDLSGLGSYLIIPLSISWNMFLLLNH